VWRFDSSPGEPRGCCVRPPEQASRVRCGPPRPAAGCVGGRLMRCPRPRGGAPGPPVASASSGRRLPAPFSDREREEATPQLQALTVRVHHTQLRRPLPLRGQSAADAGAPAQVGRGEGVFAGQASVVGLGHGQGQGPGPGGAPGVCQKPSPGVRSKCWHTFLLVHHHSAAALGLCWTWPFPAPLALFSICRTLCQPERATQRARAGTGLRAPAAAMLQRSLWFPAPSPSTPGACCTCSCLGTSWPSICSLGLPWHRHRSHGTSPQLTRLMLLPTSHALLSMHADGAPMWQRRRCVPLGLVPHSAHAAHRTGHGLPSSDLCCESPGPQTSATAVPLVPPSSSLSPVQCSRETRACFPSDAPPFSSHVLCSSGTSTRSSCGTRSR